METNIAEALKIMAVGMTAVFLILAIVTASAQILILTLNKFDVVLNRKDIPDTDSDQLSDMDRSVIEAAVRKWSGGNARIQSISPITKT